MRLRLTCNAAGDIRLQLLRDTKVRLLRAPATVPPLVCSSLFQELKNRILRRYRVGFGVLSTRSRFTRHARMTLRCAGAILDNYPKRQVLFLTGTLPGSSETACIALAADSGWVVQTLKQWIRDFAPGSQFFGVWEWQKRGALHVHLVVACPSEGLANQIASRFKRRWILILDKLCSRRGVDLYQRKDGSTHAFSPEITRTDVQRVDKNVGRYLAKYLSKGSTSRMNNKRYAPSAWYFCSKSVTQEISRRKVQTQVLSLPAAQAHQLFEKAGGVLVGEVSRCYSYRSPGDAMVFGVIALATPIHASFLYNHISAQLRVIQLVDRDYHQETRAAPHMVASFFCGVVLAAA